jgi:hypothetical protein
MGSAPRKQSKTYKVPKRPYEAARLDAELKVGFGHLIIYTVPCPARAWKERDGARRTGVREDRVEMFLKPAGKSEGQFKADKDEGRQPQDMA